MPQILLLLCGKLLIYDEILTVPLAGLVVSGGGRNFDVLWFNLRNINAKNYLPSGFASTFASDFILLIRADNLLAV